MVNRYYIVITPFFPTNDKFTGPYISDQVKALERNSDFKVHVFKPKPWYSKAGDYSYEGVRVYRFSIFELPSNILPRLFEFLSLWSLERKLKNLGIDPADISVVHAHVTGLGVFANALKKKHPKILTVLQHHGFDVLSLQNGVLRNFKPHIGLVRRYGIKIANKIDLHVGVSQKTLDHLKSFKGTHIKDDYVLYNGVDTSKFYPIAGLKDPKQFTIGCIGNFWPLKDQITLLKAVKKLSEDGVFQLRVKLVGTGVTLDACKQFVDNNNMVSLVDFIPEIPHKELVLFYNSLDLFVLPSYYEAFGCVYTEAYACGVPFMAVEGQGIAELIPVEDQHIWLIEKGNYLQLSDKIKMFYKSKRKQTLSQCYGIDTTIVNFINYLNKYYGLQR